MDSLLVVLIVSFLATAIPTFFYIAIALWLDRYEKEPLWLITVTFLWGAVPAIIVSLIAEIALDIPIQTLVTGEATRDVIGAALVAPVVEEIAKAIPLFLIFSFYKREFDGLMDGLIYGSLVGFGFAMTENVFYFLSAFDEGGWEALTILFVLRALVFGLNHALFTSALGAGLGYARYASNGLTRRIAPLVGLLGAIGLHMIHNFFVSTDVEFFCFISLFSDWLGVIVWLALVFWATSLESKWIKEELAEEVDNGLLRPEHAQAAARYRTRLRDRWATLQEKGFGRAHRLSHLHALSAELALKKRQLRLFGETIHAAEVDKLRNQISQLVPAL